MDFNAYLMAFPASFPASFRHQQLIDNDCNFSLSIYCANRYEKTMYKPIFT